MQLLENKVAIITGASGGIGQACARLFAQHGARLVLAGRRREILEQIQAELSALGTEVIVQSGDLRDEAEAQLLSDAAMIRFGRLDIAINNAGSLGKPGPLTGMSLQDWNETVDSNLTSAFLASKYQLQAMRSSGGGSLVFTSSFVGHSASFPGMGAYAASKAALIGLAQTLALEHAADGIRVNALLPGGTDTAMLKQFAPTGEAIAALQQLYPGRQLAEPQQIAGTLLFLASELSAFVTASALLADGGISVYHN